MNISNVDECINFEVGIANNIFHLIQLYRSPSQKQDEFQAFKSNPEMNLDSLSTSYPFLTVLIRDFNARTSNWYLNNKTSFGGSQIEFFCLSICFVPSNQETSYILDNLKPYKDLMFTSQPNMTMDYVVHSLCSNSLSNILLSFTLLLMKELCGISPE